MNTKENLLKNASLIPARKSAYRKIGERAMERRI
jgi:hypothetical protein